MSTAPLNPTLHSALRRVFGEVRVSHRGEPFVARVVRDEGRPKLNISHFGEAYMVCCPSCRDKGLNLSVNHRFGTRHPSLAYPLTFLVTCFTAHCHKQWDFRDELYDRLGGEARLATARIGAGTTVPSDPSTLPGSFTRLDNLGPSHSARTRLAALRHDPDRLARVFGVGYCPAADVRVADERVIVPVRKGGDLVGWLAAECAADGIKFFKAPNMASDTWLYNLDRVKDAPTAVLVPTVEWVWRVGTFATAPLGRVDPARLLNLLRKRLPGQHLIVAGVPDTSFDTRQLARRLAMQHPSKVVHVQLPATAGAVSRGDLREMLQAAAAERGLPVNFTRPA
jgi:hypothetical protein